MIELQNVTFGYPLRKPIIQDFSLTVSPGEPVCLTGASGQGKTTVLRLLMGLERPRSGQVVVPQGLRTSAVFQEDRLLRGRTALENVALFSDAETAEKTLCALGLQDALHQYPRELSGGMKRRVALARALSHPFDLLVLDEAFTGLDEATRQTCLAAVAAAVTGEKYLVMATHSADEADHFGARLVAIR